MNQKKKIKFTNSKSIYDKKLGDCKVIDELIDARIGIEVTLCDFTKEVFPGVEVSLKVDIATNQPVVLDIYQD